LVAGSGLVVLVETEEIVVGDPRGGVHVVQAPRSSERLEELDEHLLAAEILARKLSLDSLTQEFIRAELSYQ
jgi:hypothetical protein